MESTEHCSVDGCVAVVRCRGWCSKHYTRWQRHGDTAITLRNPPATGDATEKMCPRCGNTKPIDQFGLRSNGTPKGYCRNCEAQYQATHAATTHGREQRRVARSKWNDGNHGYFLNYRYGITVEDYDQMLADQDGRCAICGTDEPGSGNVKWAVDHCHDSLKVRGLLCTTCNTGLGYFKDDPQRLRAAAEYLEDRGVRSPQ